MSERKVFEVILEGFNGSTDKTDHLIKWVDSNNINAVETWVEDNCNVPAVIIEETDIPINSEGIDGKITWYKNFYRCAYCNIIWNSHCNYVCNDRCPSCNLETKSYGYIEI